MPATLFSPIEIRGVRLPNRVVVSPMWQYAGKDGKPTPTHTVHYGRLAEGGAGLVVVEGTTVDRRGRGTVGDLGIWDDSVVPLHARLVDVVRAGGAVPGIQLIHAGRKGRRNPPWDARTPPPSAGWPVLAPSAIPLGPDGFATPVEMTPADIEDTVAAFANAARRADEAGYEVLELQAAHGYLIHSFLSPLANRRADRYGGSTENRFRFLVEIVDRVRNVWPDRKALFVRLSCVDVEWSIDQTVELVRELGIRGVDVVDCSSGGIVGRPSPGVTPDYGYQVPYAEQIRTRTGLPTMAVGHIVHATQAQSIVENGQADLVALGRELLYNPNWPLDAARKLGVSDPYAQAPTRISYWLSKREDSFPGFAPSTEGLSFRTAAGRRAGSPRG
ncbi:2,4-dienoyl-CoA reductase-like NADH-dependent reductase (Old Yellow Enzyme family) [Amycolatopsis bartoniae]|uniref:NADH:flavin oxidoreductase / NADH oxidase n=1 Tax=Amycolatopsis bartoniae TaxID=941986 RepID=A0A8H9J695_9PSEU|nr:NADH:flavin oxidoreductase/NADH oxidase [Amycolatopsis bartoniae]MBB2939404.1 2,4-dienoyl-CoA reductase-like NADH-dependent reductase (Old Yellow Enzyme family) [Amycolatopsis bartoniae]TVT00960.1 NADH:flavin oxidoreductase/NADH oxidase [Amycolatopsis bartoniae]GHF83240.1 NADH:flavin oxidoreductase / NADH oxidase [Amycolatopsis bartoniae]